MPQKKYKVTLVPAERAMLQEIATRGKHNSQKVLNTLILLACDEGESQTHQLSNHEIAATLPVSMRKIDRLKKRFVEEGLEMALDKRKAQRTYARKTDGDFEAHLVALSCSKPPEGCVRWTLRLLAEKMVELGYVGAISHETVRGVLKKTK